MKYKPSDLIFDKLESSLEVSQNIQRGPPLPLSAEKKIDSEEIFDKKKKSIFRLDDDLSVIEEDINVKNWYE